jgi:Na+-transporting NADH:ubiquinone oxidoreductase subunit NqrF
MQQWNCFVATTDNVVTSIKKFALMNADPGTVMFNEVSFATIAKDATKEFFFRYQIFMTQK